MSDEKEQRGIAYVRNSTEEQKQQGTSGEAQRQKCLEYAKKLTESNKYGLKYEIVDYLCDEGFSGKNTNRPRYKAMWELIEKEKIDFIIASELSRLCRSVTDFLELIDHCERHSVDVIVIGMDFDSTSPMGKVFLTILMALAQFERELTAHRTRENALSRLKSEGRINGASEIWGLVRDRSRKGHFLPDDDELVDVKKIFNLFIKLGNKKAVIDEAKKQGLARKNGDKLTPHVLDVMLKNARWRYRGQWYYEEDKKINSVSLPHGPVVDVQLLDKVIEKSEDYKLKNKKLGKRNYCYLLSNILIDEDGTPFKGHSANGRGGQYRYYKNPNYKRGIRADDIHDFIISRFRAYIMETKIIQRMIDDEFKNRVSYVPEIEREIRQIKKRLLNEEKTIRFYESEGVQGIGSEMFVRKFQNYEELVTKLNLRLEGLQEEKSELVRKLEIDSIEARLKKFLECFSNATESQKRDILEMVFKGSSHLRVFSLHHKT